MLLISFIVFSLLWLLIGRSLLPMMVIVVLASASAALLLDSLLIVLVHLHNVAPVGTFLLGQLGRIRLLLQTDAHIDVAALLLQFDLFEDRLLHLL